MFLAPFSTNTYDLWTTKAVLTSFNETYTMLYSITPRVATVIISICCHARIFLDELFRNVGIRFPGFIPKKSALTKPNWFGLNWFFIWSDLCFLKSVYLSSVGFFRTNRTGPWTALVHNQTLHIHIFNFDEIPFFL
jgi:hypothetical protein